jgi:hypothetical protein
MLLDLNKNLIHYSWGKDKGNHYNKKKSLSSLHWDQAGRVDTRVYISNLLTIDRKAHNQTRNICICSRIASISKEEISFFIVNASTF